MAEAVLSTSLGFGDNEIGDANQNVQKESDAIIQPELNLNSSAASSPIPAMEDRLGSGDTTSNPSPSTATGTTTSTTGAGASRPISSEEEYILGLDIGTTTLRAHVYDKQGKCRGSSYRKQELLQPHPGWCEIDPEKLFESVKAMTMESIQDAGLRPSQIKCMGLTFLRATFITWDSETGKPFHNFIGWQDLRSNNYVSQWNRSYTIKSLNLGAKILHTLMRKKRHLAASVLKFMASQVTMRLLWILDNVPNLRSRASQGCVRFGTVDTWLLWRMTGGKSYYTDYSCASSTGLFDPFQMEWSTIVCGLVNIPMSIFPEVRDTCGHFGTTDHDAFGLQVPILSMMADQQAAMFGHCCFEVGDIKCTMGTGTFIDLNTGSKPHASIAGLYPLVGWKIGDELTYIAEGQVCDTGNVVDWAKSVGFFTDVGELVDMAKSVEDSDGVYFVPAFSGLQAPFNDNNAVTSMFGIKPTTTKAHIMRSIMEAVAFRFKALYETVLTETKLPLCTVKVDGGVASNDFIVQLMSDLIYQNIHRCRENDLACLGAVYMAGLGAGIWKSKEQLRSLRQPDKEFKPRDVWQQQYKKTYTDWENAVARSREWYS